MPTVKLGEAEIYYEVLGTGYPLMIFAPGGLRSELAFWRHSPSDPAAKPVWMDPMTDLSGTYKVIALDQRNAGKSRAPVSGSHDWVTFAHDHLALADHLGIDRFHVMGGCIGASYCLKLCQLAPQRITAAVLQTRSVTTRSTTTATSLPIWFPSGRAVSRPSGRMSRTRRSNNSARTRSAAISCSA
ncbi:MAG TPA: alpha/beta hydrolase [Stellaceae bacterium]|nr:alpha/beta hydrolase [Stellaceae bacterium]